ncbi:hypothetical protein BSKO_01553 [Bryopsis sp. KO-2023]|nr:hypothetical protein BSKO_01553 [Bryopsis sp. KO-2023]
MSFFSRILNHVVNEVLVNSLANSRIFQRFAIRSNEAMKEVVEKGKVVSGQAAEFTHAFTKEFRTELQKGASEIKKGASELNGKEWKKR